MNVDGKTIRETLANLWVRLRGNASADEPGSEDLLPRPELFSSEQMRTHGKFLASTHELAVGHVWDRLLARLADNERVLLGAFDVLAAAVKANRRIAPAGEWLLDNFYLIEEQIRTARRHLPKGYSRELPRLANGPSAGLPRVYDIALETIAHGDGRVDPESLGSFVNAYQSVTALKLGELWAIPIMLRLALIENLRHVGARVAADRISRNRADYWADQMTAVAEKDPKSLILVIADMARSGFPMVNSFVAEFARRLQGQSPALALPLNWIAQLLMESGQTIEQSVQSENQQQAADQVSISNSIGSLRFLEAMDWREFVETMSAVERKLLADPVGIYGRMDFATRDRYRHVVEKTAKASELSEGEVAQLAVKLADDAAARSTDPDDRTTHVGYYLIDKGLPHLESAAQADPPVLEKLRRTCRRYPVLLYVGAIALIAAAISAGLLHEARLDGLRGWPLGLFGVVVLLCTSQLSVALVNWLATVVATPHLLPRMDFSAGIPPESRTLVVVPTMLTSARGVEGLIEALEVRFLANRTGNLHFGLLTDFPDAPAETLPTDEPLLRLARNGIERLNASYRGVNGDSFFLFHRPRRWNAQDKLWMGYERKRGKLADLNAFLRGATDRFSLVVGETAALANVKYVITLDTDTQLPRDTARQFIGAMAHPLNRARYDDARELVVEGYGILQPRVAASLQGANRSPYARMCGAEAGIDPYTRAVSDVYQDLFREGSFVGKGIYDVDAFERALAGRFPENRILSHDLLEGCYARSGLLSDAHLYEEDPYSYRADVSRRSRWIRGDWQIARWLLPGVPGAAGRRQKNPLSALSRWKIFDNLRRSLVPTGLTLLLLLGWTLLSPAWFWTLSVLGILAIPALIALTVEVFQKPRDVLLRQHLAAAGQSAKRRASQLVFTLACLPYEACYSLDAILRTAGRMLFTRRRLLEWTLSGTTDSTNGSGLADSWRAMWAGAAIAATIAIHLAALRPAALLVAAPILALWWLSPVIAWWFSRPLVDRTATLSQEQTVFLRKAARRTWAFFDTFVGPEDNWLPPDNYQEQPAVGVAHRTSPTNIGLALLANLSAHDFGYISAGRLIERTSNTLGTMAGLERQRGHFYNWYDTQSLKPLLPAYISTVDSGNLAAHLLTLRPGLLALADCKIVGPRLLEGLRDTLGILVDAVAGSVPVRLVQLQAELDSADDSRTATLAATRSWLQRLQHSIADATATLAGSGETEAQWWTEVLSRQCQDALDDLTFLAPWTASSSADNGPGEIAIPGISGIPTLRELAGLDAKLAGADEQRSASNATGGERDNKLEGFIALASQRAAERIAAAEQLAHQASEFADIEYDFLFEEDRHLLTIGYNVGEHRCDSSYYDLLASEARLCTFVAIAQGRLPQESWFALGRMLTTVGGEPVLVSWSGSMFEYLMPLLVMPTYENSLLDQTGKAAVQRQIEYGRQRGVPW
ncbi:MAG TPA: cyclic beta 1-2 glucan synthetase, partial [Burkholderiales bacterium]|nr:cyclic beta 1-2 glucan synthetase [Burkholderiales bacterium]